MLSPSQFISCTLKVGTVYKIKAPELIETEVPHYFVVLAVYEDNNFLLLSTTQLNKKITFLNKNNLDLSTLVYLSPSEDNGLTKDSYFDCNKYYYITTDNLKEKFTSKNIEYKGDINKEEHKKLIDATLKSKINDIPKFLLRQPK